MLAFFTGHNDVTRGSVSGYKTSYCKVQGRTYICFRRQGYWPQSLQNLPCWDNTGQIQVTCLYNEIDAPDEMFRRRWSVWTPTWVYWVHRAMHNSAGIWKDRVHTVTQMPFQRAGCQLAKTWELCWKTDFWKASPSPEPGSLNLLSPWLPPELFSPSSANTEHNSL